MLVALATGVALQTWLMPADTPSSAVRHLTPLPLVDLQGSPVDIDQLRGRRTIVYLWASWCAPCLQTLTDIANLPQADNNDRAPAFVTLALDEDRDKVQAIIDQSGFQGTTWRAPEGILALQRGVFGDNIAGLPYVIEVDEQLQIRLGSHKIKTVGQWRSLLSGEQQLRQLAALTTSL